MFALSLSLALSVLATSNAAQSAAEQVGPYPPPPSPFCPNFPSSATKLFNFARGGKVGIIVSPDRTDAQTHFSFYPKGGASFDLNKGNYDFRVQFPKGVPGCDTCNDGGFSMSPAHGGGCFNNGGRVTCSANIGINSLNKPAPINATNLAVGTKVKTCLCLTSTNWGKRTFWCTAYTATVTRKRSGLVELEEMIITNATAL